MRTLNIKNRHDTATASFLTQSQLKNVGQKYYFNCKYIIQFYLFHTHHHIIMLNVARDLKNPFKYLFVSVNINIKTII